MQTAIQQTVTTEGQTAQATQDIDDFIYLMSHDVRASVRALIELPQWIAEDLADAGIEVTGSVAQSIEMMNRHTARLDRMLADLLAYSRVGRLQEVSSVCFDAALDEVLGDLHLPETMVLTREISASRVTMGEQDARLMLSALVGNAVKHRHTPEGRIHVSTKVCGETVCLRICDDGPGIPEKFHQKAVAAMSTLRPRDEVEGTGMGLANVRKIAAHYGGHMTLGACSCGLGGLSVDVTLPLASGAHGCGEASSI